MARHHRRRHRRFGDPVVSMPAFGGIEELNPFGHTIKSTDAVTGAIVGVLGGSLIKGLQQTYWPTAPLAGTPFASPLASFTAGLVAYSLLRKKSAERAKGVLAGAAAIAIAPAIYSLVVPMLPSQYFADPVVAMPGFSGLLTGSAGPPAPMSGLLAASPGPSFGRVSTAARRALGY